MINENQGYMNRGLQLFVFLCLSFLVTALNAASLTINLVDQAGNPVNGFRWMLERDNTYAVDPQTPATTADELLSLGFHRSNHEVALDEVLAQELSGYTDGDSTDNGAQNPTEQRLAHVPAGRYYVSVFPYSGYSISGAPVDLRTATTGEVTVTVQEHPIPTAQISIYLFEDNYPVNGVPDLPEEQNDGSVDWSEFELFLEEPGGRYGIAGGQVIRDAYGNALGTEYDQTCDTSTPTGLTGDNPDPAGMIVATCVTADGSPVITKEGDGTVDIDPVTGFVNVKNLAPGKYGVVIIPPREGGWQQTSTIEGSKVIDAWVKANEPSVFVEFGIPGPHVFMGFVRPFTALAPTGNTTTISGVVTDMHMSRSPATTFFSGRRFPACWVALNQVGEGGALGRGVYADACNGDSEFAIPNVPAGEYQLAIWDANLDVVFAAMPVSVDANGDCNAGTPNERVGCTFQEGDLAVFNWFTRLNAGVFNDDDQDGFWDPNERGIGPESQDVSLRWRDGTIYQNFPTDGEGLAPFDEVFPFFHWLVAEVSFGNKKATGATYVVDAGGPVPAENGWVMPSFGELNPQPQAEINPHTGNNLSRTEAGVELTQAFQGFLGQVSVMQFGKTEYVSYIEPDFTRTPPLLIDEYVGENGGISGMVYYATTRAEDEPQFAAAEEWEPGLPRIQLALYADGDIDCPPLGDFPNSDCDIDWNQNGNLDLDNAVIDDINNDGNLEFADVDNHPLGWSECGRLPTTDPNYCSPGIEDVDHDGDGTFDLGDALAVTHTDSWDDNLPTGCGGTNNPVGAVVNPVIADDRCFDGLRNFNQVRPGVFDGGFAFEVYDPAHLSAINPALYAKINAFYESRNAFEATVPGLNLPDADPVNGGGWLIPGEYIVESATPPGYKLVREHHKNVDYGDEYIASTQAFPVPCVGDLVAVPPLMAIATTDGSGELAMALPSIADDDAALDDAAAPFAGDLRYLCDKKKVQLSAAQNAAAEFFLMTDVPKAANISGMILNDLANEFDPTSPQFGEKFAPPNVPVAFYDWNGNEVNRIYSDQFGRYNLLAPSTTTANLPIPSGMSPNMLVSCMNDAGPILNPDYNAETDTDGDGIDGDGDLQMVVDPHYDDQYSQFCYTFQYMPGTITYLDTPVEPIAAFAGPGQAPLDCEAPTSTPKIFSVERAVPPIDGIEGPYVVAGTEDIVIKSMGIQEVRNPEWDGVVTNGLKMIERDYGFGTVPGRVYLEDREGNQIGPDLLVDVGDWGNNQIIASTDGVAPGEYQLLVEDSNGSVTPMGVMLTVGHAEGFGPSSVNRFQYNVVNVPSAQYPTIQDAIGDGIDDGFGTDGVSAGDLIIVKPGNYEEMVIMWKPVKLQGFGAGAVTINARQSPTEKIIAWRELASRLANGSISLLPGQQVGAGNPLFEAGVAGALGAPIFATEEGAGILVAGSLTGPNRFNLNNRNRNARIDGFTIVGASTGGGIVVNGYTEHLNIANNRINGNAGFYGGGIRVGHTTVISEVEDDGHPFFARRGNRYREEENVTGHHDWLWDQREDGFLTYDDTFADRLKVHHNEVVKNGGSNGAGGGISIHTGAHNYQVRSNWVCGNFSKGDGGGIAHLGYSNNGKITDNTVIFNETFSQTPGTRPAGGGIFVGGLAGLRTDEETGLVLSHGAGDVDIIGNQIRGNLAGAGDGGGIALVNVNGEDIARAEADVDDRCDDVPNEETCKWNQWNRVRVYNNIVANNVSGLAGGGISLADTVHARIRHNTVTNNDTTATSSYAFSGNPNASEPKPAGVVSRYHTNTMETLTGLYVENFPGTARDVERSTFSDILEFRNNIIYHNRSYFWDNVDNRNRLVPATCDVLTDTNCDVATVPIGDYTEDVAVLNGHIFNAGGMLLAPNRSLLEVGVAGVANNLFCSGEKTNLDCEGNTFTALFENDRFNTARNSFLFPEFKVLQVAGAFDEGGNFLQVNFGPLSLTDIDGNPGADPLIDYHLAAGSPAIDLAAGGTSTILNTDIDGDDRPLGPRADAGADERE
ncbi:MAG: hypothetical protein AB2606_08365 [Candidatus Thiodiazotropha taylori]